MRDARRMPNPYIPINNVGSEKRVLICGLHGLTDHRQIVIITCILYYINYIISNQCSVLSVLATMSELFGRYLLSILFVHKLQINMDDWMSRLSTRYPSSFHVYENYINADCVFRSAIAHSRQLLDWFYGLVYIQCSVHYRWTLDTAEQLEVSTELRKKSHSKYQHLFIVECFSTQRFNTVSKDKQFQFFSP